VDGQLLRELIHEHPVVAYPDEPLRAIAFRMAESGFTRLPVVERGSAVKLAGMIALSDLLTARTRQLHHEQRRERVFRWRRVRAHRPRPLRSPS
jgi:CBS domain containing-hemolysin-like protein